MTRISIFLIIVALIIGMVGCDPYADYIKIYDWTDLDDIRNNLEAKYVLMNNLDSTTAGYDELASPTANQGKGWEPIGTVEEPFTGLFNGKWHEIHDMFINRHAEKYVGLFGRIESGALVKNIGVVNADVTGSSHVGGLVGFNEYGIVVNNCHATGSLIGSSYVGGLVGWNRGTISNSYYTGSVTGNVSVGGLVGSGGDVSNSYSTGSVNGDEYVGGLVGYNYAYYSSTTVSNSYSTASVSGNSSVGGLVGFNYYAVSNSYSTGSVTGVHKVGGLVGHNNGGTVSDSYSTGNVHGPADVGGLVGFNDYGTVSNSYSTGSVTGHGYLGGLVGQNHGTVSNSYSTGSVRSEKYISDLWVGGLVGYGPAGTVTNSFWNTETSGQATSKGGIGKTTTEMQDITTFSYTGWYIGAVANPSTRNPYYTWNIVDGETYPFFRWEPVS